MKKTIELEKAMKVMEIALQEPQMEKKTLWMLLELAADEERGEEKEQKRKEKRKVKRWTEKDDAEILRMAAAGRKPGEIAKEIGRTEGSVRMRMRRIPEKIQREAEKEEEAFGNTFRSADVALMMNCSSYQLKKVAELVEVESGKIFQRAEDTRERLYTWEDTKLLKRVHELIQKGNRRNESVQLALEEKRNREKAEEEKGQ